MTFPPLSDALRLARIAPPRRPIRIVVDTDTYNEIDDQYALVYALLSLEKIIVEAIYAAPFYNHRSKGPGHGMDLSYDEILRLLARLNRKAEGFVFRGVRDYVGTEKEPKPGDAIDDLIRRARALSADDPLYVVAIGAISNVSSALLKAPDIVERIVVVWLGGHALDWPDTREFNLRQDIGGAQVLLDSGVPLVLVPCMGVTSHLHSTVAEIERYVEPCGAIGAFLAQRFKEYCEGHAGGSKVIWDMATIAYLLEESWTPSVLLSTPIVTDQATWSVDHRRPLMRYVRYVDRDPIFRDFFRKLASLAG
jgi:inosine-uridine nucleoside N-ribohydrolase